MAIIQGNAKKSTVSGFYPKTIKGSLRFNDDDSAYLSLEPTGTSGGRTTFTYSGWVKISKLSTANGFYLIHAPCPTANNLNGSLLYINSSDVFRAQIRTYNTGAQGAVDASYTSSMVFRDPSAWYHIVFAFDSTATLNSPDTMRLWVNGVLQTNASPDYPSASGLQYLGSEVTHEIGRWLGSSHANTNGYMAEVFFIDGTAYTADAFGETKNGVWVPKNITATDFTMGTNGFHLTFQDDTAVEVFNTVLWRGSGGTQSITGMGFQPDLIWIKGRSDAYSSRLFDTVRGVDKVLVSDASQSEFDGGGTTYMSSFDSDGFNLTSNISVNGSNKTYVAWGWKAGGAPTVDNSAGAGNVPTAGSVKIDGVNSTSALAGTIPATRISASDTYGFSIVSYTGDGGASATIGHGLTSAPDMLVVKNRDNANAWRVYHSALGNTKYLTLNAPDGAGTASSLWNNTSPTSSVFTIGTDNDVNNTNNYIAYCWAEKSGYSKFGSYTGNLSTDGPRIYTTDDGTAGGANGFKPAFVLAKRIDTGSSNSWWIVDNTRSVSNPVLDSGTLYPNSSQAEPTSTNEWAELLEDGFKIKSTFLDANANGGTYIYAAFADTREAAFWLDQSGNNNDWQPVNLDHNDTVADSPTDNFATLNPLTKRSSVTYSEGNLKVVSTSAANSQNESTIFVSTGKWYAEVTVNVLAASSNLNVGITKVAQADYSDANYVFFNGNGNAYRYGTNLGALGTSFSAGDVLGLAYNADDQEFTLYKNNTPIYTITGLDDVEHAFYGNAYAVNDAITFNFGQQPFKYDPPA